MKQIYHFRLLYAVVIVLTTCLLIVGGAYRIKSRQADYASAKVARQEAEIRELRIGFDEGRDQFVNEWKARQNAIAALTVWESMYPEQVEKVRRRVVDAVVVW